MYLARTLGACLLGALLHSGGAHAQASLTLEDAVGRALERNPELAGFAYELKAQQAHTQAVGARPPIEAGLLVENIQGSGTRSDFDAAETTLSLGLLLERGARQRRRDVALAGGVVLGTELNVRRIDMAAEVGRRFITVLEDQQRIVELRRARELAAQTLESVQLRVRAAKVPEAEEARAQAQLARSRLDEEQAEHELLTARRRLAALWAESEPTFDEARGTLSALPPLPTFESVRAELDKNPEFERYVSEQRLRESELRLAETKRRPPWQVTAGVRRFEEGDDHAFVVGLTVPIAPRDYAQGTVAEARARAEGVDSRRSARRIHLETELFAIYQDLKHAYTEVDLLRDEVLPRMERAADESRYAYERGRYGYTEWVGSQRELLDVRRSLSAAYANAHRLRVEIERLTGASLIARTTP